MNKLQVEKDSIIELEAKEYEIEITNDCNVLFKALNNKAQVSLLIKSSKVKIEIFLESETNLLINQLGIDSSIDYVVHIKDNSKLFVVDSILSNKESINNIKLSHEGQNSETKFYTNGVNLGKNKMYFYLDGIIPEYCKGVFLEENSKIINLKDGDSKIIPNLIVDTKEVIANHSAFIGTLNKDDIYYLMSRKISKNQAEKLLMKSMLLQRMTLNTEKFIKEIALNMDKGGII